MSGAERKLIFVRHGQSLSNSGGPTTEDALNPLTALGLQQAQIIAKRLPVTPSRVVASPFLRAQHTAQAYAARVGCGIETHPELREFSSIDPDLLQGLVGEQRRPITTRYWQQADPHLRMGTRAETFAEFDGRVQRFIDHDLPTLPDGAVLFGHGRWIGLLAWKLGGARAAPGSSENMRAFWQFLAQLPMPNTAAYMVRCDASGRAFFGPMIAAA